MGVRYRTHRRSTSPTWRGRAPRKSSSIWCWTIAATFALYDTFQASFCAWQPPFLVAWGSRDAHFIPAGALAYKRDLPKAQVHLLDAGHFALEMHAQEIGRLIPEFLGRLP